MKTNTPCTKIVLFDFDKTLTIHDSFKLLLKSLLINAPYIFLKNSLTLIKLVILKSQVNKFQEAKNAYIACVINAMSIEKLDKVKATFVMYSNRDMRELTKKKLDEYISKNYEVLIVTASPQIFIEAVFDQMPVTVLGATFKSSAKRNIVDISSCYGPEKVIAIMNWCKGNQIKPRFISSWSDCESDMEMMQLAENRYWLCPPGDRRNLKVIDPDGIIVDSTISVL